MRFLSHKTRLDFMGQRRWTTVLSLILLAASVVSLGVNRLNLGIDFTGGVLIEVGYPEEVTLESVRSALGTAGFDEAIVQNFGTTRDVLIRLAPQGDATSADVSSRVLEALGKDAPGMEMRRVEFVGPQIGEELTVDGGLAMIWALGCIFVYILFRFHWKFSMGAVAALVHDVLIVLGFFSILQLDFDLSVLAAVLAVIGYSLNDTIVVFDRCRENLRRKSRKGSVDTFNRSINEMLGRTIMTSVTTLLVLIALYTMGGEAIRGFALALIVGVAVGTYSSIYVASSVALALRITREEVLPPPDDSVDDMGARV